MSGDSRGDSPCHRSGTRRHRPRGTPLLSFPREGGGRREPRSRPAPGLVPAGAGSEGFFLAGGVEIGGLGGALSSGGRVPAAPGGRAEERRSWLLHVWLLDAEAAAAAAARSSSSSGGGGARMLGQQQQLYSSAALLTGERSRLLTCYVQDYLECVESLPHDMQRNVSVLRELDNKYQGTFSRVTVSGKCCERSGGVGPGSGGVGEVTADRPRGPPCPDCG